MRRASAVALVLLLGGTGAAQPSASSDPFVAVSDADPMELARVVDRLGEDALLERLQDEERPTRVRLAAIAAAPFATGPELALPALARLAAGRHPHLAPAAAAAVAATVDGLDADALGRREVVPGDLAPAAEHLRTLRDDESARPDLRAVAARALSQLDAAGF